MDTAAFRRDLELIPESLHALADALDIGLDPIATLDLWTPSRVLLLGMGSSRYAAEVVARGYRALGVNVTVELASARPLPAPSPDLVVVAVSATGGSVEVRDAVAPYVGSGRLVAVTNRTASPLAEAADLVVPLHAGVEASGVACRTFRATFAAVDAVLGALSGVSPVTRFDSAALRGGAAAHAAVWESRREWLDPLAALLDGSAGAQILAPAERLSSAQQASLMLREVPRRPAFASETGDWSHVDVYLTKTQDYRALIYAGSRYDDQALEWLSSRGSRWASVGAELPGGELTIRFPGDADPAVSTLTEALIGELVAEHWL